MERVNYEQLENRELRAPWKQLMPLIIFVPRLPALPLLYEEREAKRDKEGKGESTLAAYDENNDNVK